MKVVHVLVVVFGAFTLFDLVLIGVLVLGKIATDHRRRAAPRFATGPLGPLPFRYGLDGTDPLQYACSVCDHPIDLFARSCVRCGAVFEHDLEVREV